MHLSTSIYLTGSKLTNWALGTEVKKCNELEAPGEMADPPGSSAGGFNLVWLTN